ncbi:MAG TPA: glycosyltransferase family 4 protein [Planctomycetota bacterium]|nr:glycosyltransferase family 4 protein [Planctomycetota bacterium]
MSHPLRILTLATEYPPARGYGLGRYVSEFSAALAAAGAEVHVITLNCDAENARQMTDGVIVHSQRGADHPEHYGWVSGAVLNNLWLQKLALQVIKEEGRFDVLMSHDWLGVLAAKSLKVMYDMPWVLFMHDTEPGRRNNKLTAEQLYIAETETWACQLADLVVANSDFLAGELARFHKVPKEKVAVVPCGINPARFDTACHLPDFRDLFAQPDEKLVLYLGRLSPSKGPDLLVEAIPAILAKHPKSKFVIAGDGVLAGKLQARVGELGVTDKVRFPGHLAGKVLGAAYRVADLVVVPSRYEPFGMVALEAMSCGTPVAAADVGGLKGLVPSDDVTRRFAADNPKALAVSVAMLLGRTVAEKDREGLKARAASYSWSKAAGSVLGACAKLKSKAGT